ncbi:hypothetical protein TRVA0_001S01948 [Trichomonascus vanleenenianus]|uniref:uncharacterized protein n=1 Tax=Trichomonascus vanleenenianus TaxID=2268995 RepID=UPI003ECB7990
MEKAEETKQSGPSAETSENDGDNWANLLHPSEFHDPEFMRHLEELPEEIRKRYLEETNGVNDVGEVLRLTAWAHSQHPDFPPGVTLGVEEIPGRGLASRCPPSKPIQFSRGEPAS